MATTTASNAEFQDGGKPVAQPIYLVDASGNPISSFSGSISVTNPSVGTDGSAIPTSSTLLGGSDGTNLQPLQVDGSKNLKVVQQGNVTEANSAAILADLATLAGAIVSSIVQSNNKQVNGTTISVNSGTTDAGTQRMVQGTAATGTKSNVVSNASSVTILASNTSRKGAMIYNDSTQVLYLDLSGGTASSSSYSVQIPAQGFFELPGPAIYNGLITGIWASANGSAHVTEFS